MNKILEQMTATVQCPFLLKPCQWEVLPCRLAITLSEEVGLLMVFEICSCNGGIGL